MKMRKNEGIAPDIRFHHVSDLDIAIVIVMANRDKHLYDYGVWTWNFTGNLNQQRCRMKPSIVRMIPIIFIRRSMTRDVITNWPAQYSKQNSQDLGSAFKATSQMIQLQCVCSESSNIH
jgi:hypothetical protein